MPIVRSLMTSLVKQYGPKRGKAVYYAMENAGTGPFARGKKHRALHTAFVRKHRAKKRRR